MSSINYSSAAKNKKIFDNFTVTDNFGNTYLFVRSGSGKGFFNIAKCEVFIDGKVPDRDGLVPNAVRFHDEEVAYLVAQAEEYIEHLASVETSLREWIRFRQSWSAKSKRRKVSRLQKKEAII